MLQSADARSLFDELSLYEHDPLGYVLFVFPWREPGTDLEHESGPRAWQRDVLTEIGEGLRAGRDLGDVVRVAVASGHGIGKSALVAWIVKWVLATREDARGVVTANTETQLRTKTWPEITKWHQLALDRDLFECAATALYSKDPNHEKTWRFDAITWSENNTEAFAGLHNAGKRLAVIFDEASAIADRVWEVTEGALTDAHTEILWATFGNPTVATGRFRECFRNNRHRWRVRQIDSRTVEGINKKQIEEWVADHGEDSDFVKVRVRGIFPALTAKQFISEKHVDAAWGRSLRKDQYDFAPVIISCDPAWDGGDELVIAMRQGLAFWILKVLQKNDNDIGVANLIAGYEDEHKADAVFVDLGYGTGIISAGRIMGRNWQRVSFSESPGDVGYVNKRAEMWGLARDWLRDGGCIPEDQVLRNDLLGPETVPLAHGKILLAPKETMRRRGLKSPGRGDALALTFAHPVRSKRESMPYGPAGLSKIPRGMSVEEYDPREVR